MLNTSSPLANWLWKDLYVWPQGRLAPSAYLGALMRILIVYVLFAQILSVMGPSFVLLSSAGAPADMFRSVMWGQIGAIVLIAFPVWSIFQRRVNDMRPDIRSKLQTWQLAFPLFLAGLTGLTVVHALGYSTPFDEVDLGRVRFWFVVMLFGAAFVPGGELAPAAKRVTTALASADNLLTAAQNAAREAVAAQAATRTAARSTHATASARPKPAHISTMPLAVERTRKLPEQGRVKPGWFS